MLIKLELQVTFQHTIVGLILLNNFFYLGLLLSGTKYIQILEITEIRPDPHPVYNICKPIGLKLLNKLRLGVSHLNEYRFNHNVCIRN